MKPHVLSIPRTREQLIPWVEACVAGVSLYELIQELQVLHGSGFGSSLSEICGTALPEVLECGVGALNDAQITKLLQNPLALAELQDEAFESGSVYWSQLANAGIAGQLAATFTPPLIGSLTALEGSTDPGLKSVTQQDVSVQPSGGQTSEGHPLFDSNAASEMQTARIQRGTSSGSNLESQASRVRSKPDLKPQSGNRRLVSGMLLAVTAAVLLMTVRYSWPASTPWGFERPGLLTADVSEKQMYESLSAAAADWATLTNSSPNELKLNLADLSRGCQKLLDAPLPQLATESREWLRTKCRNWKATVDQRLAALQQNAAEFESVKVEMDELMQRMTKVLESGPASSV